MYGVRYFRGGRSEEVEVSRIGVGDAPPLRGFAMGLDDSTAGVIAGLPEVRATAISLAYPATGDGGKVLAKSVAAAHERGLQVVLLPPGRFVRGNPYPRALDEVAKEAQEAGVDGFCLTWLDEEVDLGELARDVAVVRKFFSGKVILAGTVDVLIAAEGFGDVDDIAVIGPMELPRRLASAAKEVDLQAMRVFWECVLGTVESRTVKEAKGLFLLDMAVAEDELQQITYEALLLQTKGRTHVEGLFLPWSPREGAVDRLPGLMGKMGEYWGDAPARPD